MKLVFFFPYFEVSGVPVLFLSLAEDISERYHNYDVYIADYQDGYMARNRKPNSRVKLMVFKTGERFFIKSDILIMQAIIPYALRPEMKIENETKVLFWNLYPDIFFPIIFPFVFFPSVAKNNFRIYKTLLKFFWRRGYEKLRDFVQYANETGSLYFMDSSNFNRTNEILELDLKSKKFLPISSGGLSTNKKQLPVKMGLNIAWIGRLCDFKYRSVELLLKILSKFCLDSRKKINFYIVGDGPYLNYLKNLRWDNRFFEVIFMGPIKKNALDDFLLKNVDINVSMGTSALDGARLSIPTILIDFSYKEIPEDYNFRWLHDTIDYDLGHMISDRDISLNGQSIKNLINEFETMPEELQKKTYKYFKNNHSTEMVSDLLISELNKDIPAFGNYKSEYFKKSFIRRLYEFNRYRI